MAICLMGPRGSGLPRRRQSFGLAKEFSDTIDLSPEVNDLLPPALFADDKLELSEALLKAMSHSCSSSGSPVTRIRLWR
jgi:hypothetical protein